MDMKSVSDNLPIGFSELNTIKAGTDLVEMPRNFEKSVEVIAQAVKNGHFSTAELNRKVRKVLQLKVFFNLHQKCPHTPEQNLLRELNPPESVALNIKLRQHTHCLLKNEHSSLPISPLAKLVHVAIGNGSNVSFAEVLRAHLKTNDYEYKLLNFNNLESEKTPIPENESPLLITLHDLSVFPKDSYGISQDIKNYIAQLKPNVNSVLIVFGNPYALSELGDITKFSTIICTMDGLRSNQLKELKKTHTIIAQQLMGKIKFIGKMPVNINVKMSMT